MKRSVSGVGVVDKVVNILSACVDGATPAELAQRTGLPRVTVYRLAQALEVHQLLVRDRAGRWRPGPQLKVLANAVPDVLLDAAGPALAMLRDVTGHSAHLCLRRGEERVCIAAAAGGSLPRAVVPVGSVLAMTAGSGAHVLLAWEPLAVVLPLLRRCRFTDRTLAEVRRRGWAQSMAERDPAIASVSAPVRDRAGRVIASVSVAGPVRQFAVHRGERHATAVIRAGQRLSGL